VTREAVDRVLGEPAFRTRVRAIAVDIASLPDLGHAVRLFEETAGYQ
jgi:hypothetical protein